jgi:beta-glucosidase
VVVLEGGAAVTLAGWKHWAGAILMAWYPGMEGGHALADIIFGDVNPSGKLPIVWHQDPGQLPAFDNRAKEVEYGYYHGYRWFEKNAQAPEFPFGHGLSYTTYRYKNLKLGAERVAKGGTLRAEVEVTNTGKLAGEEVVQLYVGYGGSRVDRPVKELKAFTRVGLAAGESKTVALSVPAEDLAFYNESSGRWELEDIDYIVYVGSSSQDQGLCCQSARFRVGEG